MELPEGEEVEQRLSELVHLDSQAAETGMDLTLDEVYRLVGRGELDFGGGERMDPEVERIEPELRDQGDDYGWWELRQGTYLVEFNEELERGPAVLQPHPRLSRSGARHPSLLVEELGAVPLTVPEEGLALKENARISRALFPR